MIFEAFLDGEIDLLKIGLKIHKIMGNFIKNKGGIPLKPLLVGVHPRKIKQNLKQIFVKNLRNLTLIHIRTKFHRNLCNGLREVNNVFNDDCLNDTSQQTKTRSLEDSPNQI